LYKFQFAFSALSFFFKEAIIYHLVKQNAIKNYTNMKKKTKVYHATRIDADDLEFMTKLADRQGVTLSLLMRRAVHRFVEIELIELGKEKL